MTSFSQWLSFIKSQLCIIHSTLAQRHIHFWLCYSWNTYVRQNHQDGKKNGQYDTERKPCFIFWAELFFIYRAYIYNYIHLGWYLNQNLYNSGVTIRIIIRSAGVGIGIVHKNSVGVGIGIITKMTGVGIEKVCWNRNRSRNHWRWNRPGSVIIFRLSMCIAFRFLHTCCTRGTQSTLFNILIVFPNKLNSTESFERERHGDDIRVDGSGMERNNCAIRVGKDWNYTHIQTGAGWPPGTWRTIGRSTWMNTLWRTAMDKYCKYVLL